MPLGAGAEPMEAAMRPAIGSAIRIVLLALVFFLWGWAIDAHLSEAMNLFLVVGGVLLTYPLIWLGRRILDRFPTKSGAAWVTTAVHYALGFTFGVPIIRVVISHQDWPDWILPIPPAIGLALAILTGAAFLLTVANLALKGLGAPFAIALSQKLAADWLYAWTRNPMVLAALAFLLSLGLYYQSTLFMLWALILFAPALLFFIKVYEERELELRFGASYLEYRSKTPMLWPRKPG
jgi:protein-S-isoprenylcysteine O-methyltransferase Ste14